MIDQIGVVAGCPSVEPLLVSSSHRAAALAMYVPSHADHPDHEGKDIENRCDYRTTTSREFAISWRIRWNSEKIKRRSYSELRAPFDYKKSAPNTVEISAPV
jgi:hypothetical protein